MKEGIVFTFLWFTIFTQENGGMRERERKKQEEGRMEGKGERGYCTHIFVVHHLHESEFSKRPLCVGLILKRLHKLLDCHPLPSFCVHSRAGERGE